MTDIPTRTGPTPVAGSFRDPHGRVFDLDGRILRALDQRGADAYAALEPADWFSKAQRSGEVVRTRRAEGAAADRLRASGWVEVLEHDRIPVVSYPYEWSFSMRRDAALLHLDLVARAVATGFGCQDGSAYNVQFREAHPVFIDVGSFTPDPADLWPGYRQFCSLLLYPLLIEAHLGVSPAPLLRGSLEGISPEVAHRLLRGTAALRPGVLSHVKVQAFAARRYATREDPAEGVVHQPGTQQAVTEALVTRLSKLIRSLKAPTAASEWSGYAGRSHYGPDTLERKDRFVAAVLDEVGPATVLDLGCNDGRYSDLALDRGAAVVAVDADERVVDELYQRVAGQGRPILPLVIDLADPSPALGWALSERLALTERIQPNLVLALALVHHLVIGRNVPIDSFLEVLARLAPHAVLEVPHRDDPMVERLLAQKPADTHLDYQVETVVSAALERFEIITDLPLPGGTRTLLHLRRR